MNIWHQSSVTNVWSQELRLKIADSLFNNSSEGICVTDAVERIIEVNQTFCELSGYTKDELLGNTPRLLSSGLQDEEYFAAMWASLRLNGEWHGELWNRNRAGKLFAVRLNISVICNELGNVTNFLAIMADITAIKVQQQEWENIANHDQLTGLPNRTLLLDRLRQAMAQSERSGLTLAICYLDLDGFKPVNDDYGHQAGDRVLVEVAKRLRYSIREGDTVSRVGGDEFMLLLWGLDNTRECNQTLSRVVSEIGRPISLEIGEASVTVSCGVSLFPSDGKDPELLTAQADSAMYRSKMAGGNRFTYF